MQESRGDLLKKMSFLFIFPPFFCNLIILSYKFVIYYTTTFCCNKSKLLLLSSFFSCIKHVSANTKQWTVKASYYRFLMAVNINWLSKTGKYTVKIARHTRWGEGGKYKQVSWNILEPPLNLIHTWTPIQTSLEYTLKHPICYPKIYQNTFEIERPWENIETIN